MKAAMCNLRTLPLVLILTHCTHQNKCHTCDPCTGMWEPCRTHKCIWNLPVKMTVKRDPATISSLRDSRKVCGTFFSRHVYNAISFLVLKIICIMVATLEWVQACEKLQNAMLYEAIGDVLLFTIKKITGNNILIQSGLKIGEQTHSWSITSAITYLISCIGWSVRALSGWTMVITIWLTSRQTYLWALALL